MKTAAILLIITTLAFGKVNKTGIAASGVNITTMSQCVKGIAKAVKALRKKTRKAADK